MISFFLLMASFVYSLKDHIVRCIHIYKYSFRYLIFPVKQLIFIMKHHFYL